VRTLRIVLLGAPGAGKGTQAKSLSDSLGVPHISAGDLLRENVAGGTALGDEAKRYMDAGGLVPDGLVIDMMSERLERDDCAGGFILDGFPRTLDQAEELAKITDVDIVLNVTVSEDIIVRRLSGRRVCPSCGAVFNVANNPPEVDGICDRCGGGLIQRVDDRPETVAQRFETYREKTEPLIEHYSAMGLVREVDSSGSVEETDVNTKAVLGID
jgi:adenylate kinase